MLEYTHYVQREKVKMLESVVIVMYINSYLKVLET